VFVMLCTETGAPPPTETVPTRIRRVFLLEIIVRITICEKRVFRRCYFPVGTRWNASLDDPPVAFGDRENHGSFAPLGQSGLLPGRCSAAK